MRLDLDFLTGNTNLYFPVKRGTLNILGGAPSIDLSASSGDTSLLVPSDNHLASVVGVYFPDDIKNYFYSATVGGTSILVSIRDSGHPDAPTPIYSDLLVCFLVNITGGINSAYKYLGFGQQQLAYVKQYSPQTTPVTPTSIIIYEISLQISNGEADPVTILGGSSTQTQNIHKFILGFYNTDNYCPLVNPTFWGGSSNFTVLSYNGTSGIAFNKIFYINDNRYGIKYTIQYTANQVQPLLLQSPSTYPSVATTYNLNLQYGGGYFTLAVNIIFAGNPTITFGTGAAFFIKTFIDNLVAQSSYSNNLKLLLLKNRIDNDFSDYVSDGNIAGLAITQSTGSEQTNTMVTSVANKSYTLGSANYTGCYSFGFQVII